MTTVDDILASGRYRDRRGGRGLLPASRDVLDVRRRYPPATHPRPDAPGEPPAAGDLVAVGAASLGAEIEVMAA